MMQSGHPIRKKSLVTVWVGTMLSACVSYQAQPLDDADTAAVLASPDRAALVRLAEQLDHPRLHPVTIDFSRPLDGQALAVIAVLANPELRTLRLQRRIADAQVFAAGLLPDPQLALGFDSVLAPAGQNLGTALAGSLTLDLMAALVTRSIEQSIARQVAEQVRLDVAWQEWTTAGQALMLAERLPRQQMAAQLARVAAEVAERALARTLTAANRGDLKNGEVEARRIAAADASARALTAVRDADASRLDLNSLLGLRPDESLQLADRAALTPWKAPDAEALFAEARFSRLDLLAMAKGYDSQQTAVHRAILGQYPKLGITLNRARDTSHVHTFGPSVTLDLPIFTRNRGAIISAQLERERLRDDYAARLFQTRADIAALIAALDRDERSRENLAAELPKIDAIADRFEAAAQRGDLATPTAEAARAAALDQRLAWLALDQSCAEQRLALQLAVGRPLNTRPVSSAPLISDNAQP